MSRIFARLDGYEVFSGDYMEVSNCVSPAFDVITLLAPNVYNLLSKLSLEHLQNWFRLFACRHFDVHHTAQFVINFVNGGTCPKAAGALISAAFLFQCVPNLNSHDRHNG
jgi:hypothetical protein